MLVQKLPKPILTLATKHLKILWNLATRYYCKPYSCSWWKQSQRSWTKLKDGEKFADLAKEYSTDTATKDNGGQLAPFGPGKMDPAFEKAAYALKTKATSVLQ